MAAMEDLIDFDIIENQKENIQSLPGGRSARALANMFGPSPLQKLDTPTPSDTRNLNDAMRQEYEIELQSIAESDDPLDIYDRYVRWTLDAYPSAQATPSSQLLPLLERATKSFLNSAQYKNDPRYLKLWISYIRFFSDTPRETFAFLARHGIGEGLALYYEEFAAWLEGAGRWTQAEEVYSMGIEKEARPTPRLLRKFDEFQQRFAQRPQDTDEPSSPALPTVRPALAAKLDPFAPAAPRDVQAPRPSSGVGGGTTKSGKPKLQIFSDGDDAAPAVATKDTKGWESIGSLADRRKENVMEPKPWVGETLKAGGKKSSTKIPVFKDESSSRLMSYPQVTNPSEHQVIVNLKGVTERIFVNLEAVYPDPNAIGTELSIEELRGSHRGWLNRVWEPEFPPIQTQNDLMDLELITESTQVDTDELVKQVVEKLVIARDPVSLDENGVEKEPARPTKGRRMKIKEVNETQIIKAKLSSPSGPKMTKRKSSKEQTMTLHTRAATDDIYDLFSQPLPAEVEEEEEEEESSDDDDDDMTDGDYTSGAESTGTGRLISTSEVGDDNDETSDVKSVSEWSEFTTRKHVPNINNEEEEDRTNVTGFTDIDNENLEAFEIEVPEMDDEFAMPASPLGLATPISPESKMTSQTMYVPIAPEGYEAPTHPYRDPAQVSQNRLPFMTPIAEKTESSLGMPTVAQQKDAFSLMTPSKETSNKKRGIELLDDLDSSPIRELASPARLGKIAQPLLGKKLKTNPTTSISLKVQSNGGALAKEIEPKGPIIKDAQCNPVDEETRQTILDGLQPPLSTYDGYFEHKDTLAGHTADLRKFSKATAKMSKNASDKTTTNLALPPVLCFPGSDRQYTFKRELGAGAFAPVYLIENIAQEDENEDGEPKMGKGAFDFYDRKPLEALKMEDPPTAWEFYIMRQAERRLGVSRAAESIIHAYEMHLYKDEGFLIEEYRDQGTMLNIINLARADKTAAGGVMDENLVMFFTIELFRTVEALHAKGLLHGDLKADNVLVRFEALADTDVWTTKYRRDGTGGWNKKGISLIDFGRGIDMKVFKPDVQFIADWKTSAQDCAEMRELRPWTYQIDYHGLAGIIHSMLFGKYIDTVAAPAGFGVGAGAKKTWKICEKFKRYWQADTIWAPAFDLLLNPTNHTAVEADQKMPCLRGMKDIRETMELYLEENGEKGTGLMASLRKLEAAVNNAARKKL